MPSDEIVTLLLGPLGLTIGLLLTVVAFAREWVVPGKRNERAESAAERAFVLAREANDTMDKMAEALETRNRVDEARSRGTAS